MFWFDDRDASVVATTRLCPDAESAFSSAFFQPFFHSYFDTSYQVLGAPPPQPPSEEIGASVEAPTPPPSWGKSLPLLITPPQSQRLLGCLAFTSARAYTESAGNSVSPAPTGVAEAVLGSPGAAFLLCHRFCNRPAFLTSHATQPYAHHKTDLSP